MTNPLVSANFFNAFAAFADPPANQGINDPVLNAIKLESMATTTVIPPSIASQSTAANELIGAPKSRLTTSATTAEPTVTNVVPETVDTNQIVVNANKETSKVDYRLRISALASRELQIYGPNDSSNILAPLYDTGGLLFPYTPSIAISGESSWTNHDLVQTNFDILSYQRTPSATIGLSGKFTVQNQREGEYAMAVIHFLRVVTKMYFGDQDSAQNNSQKNKGKSAIAGLPPPVLRLRGYGSFMFNDLRCVVKGYSFNLDEGMDLIPITAAGGTMYLPALFTLNVTIGLQQSPRKVRKDFNLDKFRTGALLKDVGGNWF